MGKIITLSFIVLLLNSCMVPEIQQRRAFDSEKIIASEDDNYSYAKRVGRTVRNRTDIEFEGFSGTETLFSINSPGGDLIEIVYRSEIKGGQFKVVLIDPDEMIQSIVVMSGSGKSEIQLKKGKTRLKLIGRDSAGLISFEISGDPHIDYKVRNG